MEDFAIDINSSFFYDDFANVDYYVKEAYEKSLREDDITEEDKEMFGL